jgi:TRAP-type C4-dicarboxylate transport system permease small subunit
MQRIFTWIFRVVEDVSSVLLFVLTAVAFYQLVVRYLFAAANAGVDELIRVAFVWVASFGSALAFRAKAHLGVTTLLNKVPEVYRKHTDIALNAILILFMCVVVFAGIRMGMRGFRQYSEYLRMTMAYFYFCIPVGGALSILVFAENIMHALREIRQHADAARPSSKKG